MNLAQYLSPQALLAITITFPLATLLVEKAIKPILDRLMTPADELHDYAVQLATLAVDLLGVVLFMWLLAAPHDRKSVVWGLVGTVIAWLSSTQLYLTIRGPVPVTPTATYIAAFLRTHGALVRAALAPDRPPVA